MLCAQCGSDAPARVEVSACPRETLASSGPLRLLTLTGRASRAVASAGQPEEGGASQLPPSCGQSATAESERQGPGHPRKGALEGTWTHSPVALSMAPPQETSSSRGPSMMCGEKWSPQDLALPPLDTGQACCTCAPGWPPGRLIKEPRALPPPRPPAPHAPAGWSSGGQTGSRALLYQNLHFWENS